MGQDMTKYTLWLCSSKSSLCSCFNVLNVLRAFPEKDH